MSHRPGSESVTVGHDGTAACRPALAWAEEVAAAHAGARLDLVHAVTLPPIPVQVGASTADELLARHEKEARAALEEERRRLAARGVDARVELRRWLAAETVIEHARAAGAGLVVVGQHGGRAGRLLLGSVSAEVARDADAPVVVGEGRPAFLDSIAVVDTGAAMPAPGPGRR